MQHLTEEQLVSHYYHDGDALAAGAHLAECATCRAEYDRLCAVLSLVDQMPVPDRGDTYADQVWTRLRWKLGGARRRSRLYGSIAAIAAALALAFVGGILWHSRTQPAAAPIAVAQAKPPVPSAENTPKERLLLVVVSDHLDSSERMLLEVANADARQPLDMSSESRRAGELVSSNRIYRQTAARSGETRIAALLSDLEPVLIELSHAGSSLSADEVAALQKRIDAKGLLFKVRVASQQTGGTNTAPTAPKGLDL
jgi:hypothetical protein